MTDAWNSALEAAADEGEPDRVWRSLDRRQQDAVVEAASAAMYLLAYSILPEAKRYFYRASDELGLQILDTLDAIQFVVEGIRGNDP